MADDDPKLQTEETKAGKEPVLKMPSAAAVAAARAKKKAEGDSSSLRPGTVLGLPEGWVPALLDPALPEGRKATLRAKWTAKGWLPLEGKHQVVGFPEGCEVWVKKQSDYDADRQERDARLRKQAAGGQFFL